MPPKQRFTSQDVIDAAYRVVRKQGWAGFSARTIANELGASTRPIYDHFNSMENIEAKVVKKALAHFVDYLSRERTGDKWLDQALGYVMFSSKEKHLFRCINDEKHTPFQKQFARQHWAKLGEELSGDERFRETPAQTLQKMRAARWIFIHGLAWLVANGWFNAVPTEDSIFSEELNETLKTFLERANRAIYEEFKMDV